MWLFPVLANVRPTSDLTVSAFGVSYYDFAVNQRSNAVRPGRAAASSTVFMWSIRSSTVVVPVTANGVPSARAVPSWLNPETVIVAPAVKCPGGKLVESSSMFRMPCRRLFRCLWSMQYLTSARLSGGLSIVASALKLPATVTWLVACCRHSHVVRHLDVTDCRATWKPSASPSDRYAELDNRWRGQQALMPGQPRKPRHGYKHSAGRR